MKKTGMLMKRMMCVVLVMAMLMGVLPSTTVAAADNETKTTVTLKVTTTGTLQEDKVLTKRMLKDCIEVTAIEKTTIRKPGESKKVTVQDEKVITKYDCAQIGKKITYKKDYPNKGCYKLTISYKGAKKSVWVKVKKAPTVKSLKVTLKSGGAKLPEGEKFTEKLADKSLKVVATLANGKKVVIKAKDYDSKQFNKKVTYKKSGSNKGKYQVEISYKGKKQKIWIPVKKAPTVKSLTVKATQKLPEGKNLTKSMLKVTAKMSDGKTKVITDYSCAQLGKKITYGSNGKFTITVKSGGKSKKVSLSVQKAPETTFKLSAEMTGQGKLLIDGSEIAFYGGKATITIKKGNHTAKAVAADGHQLKVFEIDGQKQNASSANFSVTKAVTIKVAFEEIKPVVKHQISFASEGGKAKLYIDGTEMTTSSKAFVEGKHNATVEAPEGYLISSWSIAGNKQTGSSAEFDLTGAVEIKVTLVKTHVFNITVTGKGKVFIAGEEIGVYDGKAEVELGAGSYEFDNQPADGYKFSVLKVNGRLVSSANATVTLLDDVDVEVVFVEEDYFVNVTYKSPSGQDLKRESVKAGEALDPPTAPQLKDKEFECWILEGKKYTLEEVDKLLDAIKAITKEKKDVEVTASYKVVEKHYTVTIVGATPTDSDGNVLTDQVLAGTKLHAVLDKSKIPEGKIFAYFQNEKGEILTYDETYQTYVNSDLYIEVVYADAPVEKVPIVRFKKGTEVVRPEESENGKGYILWPTSFEIPDKWRVLECGVMYSITDDVFYHSKDTAHPDGPRARKEMIDNTTGNANYADSSMKLISTARFDEHDLVRAYVYAVIQDEDGNIQVVYSDLMKIQL